MKKRKNSTRLCRVWECTFDRLKGRWRSLLKRKWCESWSRSFCHRLLYPTQRVWGTLTLTLALTLKASYHSSSMSAGTIPSSSPGIAVWDALCDYIERSCCSGYQSPSNAGIPLLSAAQLSGTPARSPRALTCLWSDGTQELSNDIYARAMILYYFTCNKFVEKL